MQNILRHSTLAAAAAWCVAMLSYPGGNAFDPDAAGYSPVRNFICDLLPRETRTGEDNRWSSNAMALTIVLLVTLRLLPLWWSMPLPRWRRNACRILGLVTAALSLSICAEQVLDLDMPHGLLSLAAGAAGLIPTAALAVTDWRADSATTLRRATMLGALVAIGVNFVGYALVQAGRELSPVVPTAQFCALALVLLWLSQLPDRPTNASSEAVG